MKINKVIVFVLILLVVTTIITATNYKDKQKAKDEKDKLLSMQITMENLEIIEVREQYNMSVVEATYTYEIVLVYEEEEQSRELMSNVFRFPLEGKNLDEKDGEEWVKEKILQHATVAFEDRKETLLKEIYIIYGELQNWTYKDGKWKKK